MKKQTRLYTIFFPIWILWLFPPLLFIVLPGNLAIECLALFLTLLALKHPKKRAVIEELWLKLWWYGFLADLVGTMWMLLSGYICGAFFGHRNELIVDSVFLRPWSHPVGFLVTLTGIAISGVCYYRFAKPFLMSCELLTDRERRIIARVMAVVAAPWLFLFPVY